MASARATALLLCVLASGGLALAAPAAVFAAPGAVDAGLFVGLPAALGTGQTAGVAAGYATQGKLAWGARVAYSQATEHTLTWQVAHDELRLRGHLDARRPVGRGTLLARLGAGVTVVHETRSRDQSARLGESGATLDTAAWALLPGAELEVGVLLRIAGAWGVALHGGPALHLLDGALEPGWVAEVGVAWLP